MKKKLTLQRTSLWCRNFSRVILVLSIVALLVLLAFFMYFLLSAEMLTGERIRVLGERDRELELDVLDLVIYFSVVILLLIKTICLTCLYYNYFSVLNLSKSPFNQEAASALGKLGVGKIVLPVFHDVVTTVLILFTSDGVFDSSIIMNYNPLPAISTGAMMIFCAAISSYGAERERCPVLN